MNGTVVDDFVAPGDPERTKRLFEVITERTPVEELRVLDLACRTGTFSNALAKAGAYVVGIEGRAENFNRIPPHPNAEYEMDDVRNLSKQRHGTFDVSLCLGILYHLDATDAVKLLRAMREVTTGFAVIDTHIGPAQDVVTVEGQQFEGFWYGEGPGLWSSIGNSTSFWFTPDSLFAAARLAGWTNTEAVDLPDWSAAPAGRMWVVLS